MFVKVGTPEVKYTCHKCGKTRLFESVEHAFQAGWDALDDWETFVYFCGSCPAGPYLVEKAIEEINEKNNVKG